MIQMKKKWAQIVVVVYHVSIAASGYGFWTSCNKLGSTSCSEFHLFETMQTRFEFLCTLCRIETRYGNIPDGCEAGREGRRQVASTVGRYSPVSKSCEPCSFYIMLGSISTV